jgi:short-subunit dehydrogenase
MNPRTVLITGASSGIGEAFADVFAAEGFDLVITARREDRLRTVADRLRQRYARRVEVITADLSERDAPARLCDEIARRGLAIDVLVNNAGYGIPGTFTASAWARHAALLQVMVVAPAELTHVLLPGMVDRGYGRIINVASLAALVPAPAGHTLYAACKAFVVKFSESLANEVTRSGVHVTALCPGFTRSEFHDVTGTRAMVRELPSWLWKDAADVAREGFDAAMAGTPIHVTGRVNRTIATLARHLPQSVLLAFGRRTARRYRKS